MTSSGLWTPNRDLDPTLERGPIFGTSIWTHSRGADGVIPSQDGLITMNLVVCMRYTPTGNPRVHGMVHHTYTTPLEMGPNRGVSGGSQDGMSCGSDVRFEVFQGGDSEVRS